MHTLKGIDGLNQQVVKVKAGRVATGNNSLMDLARMGIDPRIFFNSAMASSAKSSIDFKKINDPNEILMAKGYLKNFFSQWNENTPHGMKTRMLLVAAKAYLALSRFSLRTEKMKNLVNANDYAKWGNKDCS